MGPSNENDTSLWKKINTGLLIFGCVQFILFCNLNKIPNDEAMAFVAPIPVEIPGIITSPEPVSSVALSARAPLYEAPPETKVSSLPPPSQSLEPSRGLADDQPATRQPASVRPARISPRTARREKAGRPAAKALRTGKSEKRAARAKTDAKKRKAQAVAKSTAKTRKPTSYLEPVKITRDTHQSVTLTRQNSMNALDRAASRAADESYQENSQRRQSRRDASALSSAHVSGTFEEE